MVSHRFDGRKPGQIEGAFSHETQCDKHTIRHHLISFNLLQCVALQLEAAYETAKTLPSEDLLSRIILSEQQFNDLFKCLFHCPALGKPYFKEMVEAVCNSARVSRALMPVSTLMH